MVTVTVTSTAASSTIVVNSSDPITCHGSLSSSAKPTAIGFGVGVPLGLALLGAFGLIRKQRSRELSTRKEAYNWEQKTRAWEEKYNDLLKEKRGDSTSAAGEIYELGNEGWRGREELDGRRI